MLDLEPLARLVSTLDETDPESLDLPCTLHSLAGRLATVLGSRHGTGSWAASHALRSLTDDDVALLLTAYGATTFTVQQHTETLREILQSISFRGGSPD